MRKMEEDSRRIPDPHRIPQESSSHSIPQILLPCHAASCRTHFRFESGLRDEREPLHRVSQPLSHVLRTTRQGSLVSAALPLYTGGRIKTH